MGEEELAVPTALASSPLAGIAAFLGRGRTCLYGEGLSLQANILHKMKGGGGFDCMFTQVWACWLSLAPPMAWLVSTLIMPK